MNVLIVAVITNIIINIITIIEANFGLKDF